MAEVQKIDMPRALQTVRCMCGSVASSLGPTSNLKAIFGDLRLVGDAMTILNELDVSHPFAQLLRDTIAVQYDAHGTVWAHTFCILLRVY